MHGKGHRPLNTALNEIRIFAYGKNPRPLLFHFSDDRLVCCAWFNCNVCPPGGELFTGMETLGVGSHADCLRIYPLPQTAGDKKQYGTKIK